MALRRTTWIGALLLLVAVVGPRPAAAGRAADVRAASFRLLDEGVSAYNRGLYTEAADKLQQCSAMSLSSFRAYYYYGLTLGALRRHSEAVVALDVALDLDPGHLQAWIARGDAFLQLGDIEQARAGYYGAIKLRPAYAAALDGLARTYEAREDLEQATSSYRQAIQSDRGFAPAYVHLGDLYLRQGRVQEAVLLLEEAVTIRPDFAGGLNRLAAAYGRLGLTNEAVATIRKAIDLEPGAPDHAVTEGWLELGQAALGPAESSFRRALELDAHDAQAHWGLAEIARRRGDYAAALAAMDQAVAAARPGGALASRLATARESIEAERSRAAALEAGVASGTAAAEDFAGLASILATRGLWDRAAELERRGPDAPGSSERLAYMLVRSGQFREAHEIYARLAEVTGDPRQRFGSAVALALAGDDESAAREYARVLVAPLKTPDGTPSRSEEPAQGMARLYLANSLLRLGRTGEAAQAYRAFIDGAGAGHPEAAERARRILLRIAPDLAPPLPEALPAPPPPPPDEEQAPPKETGP